MELTRKTIQETQNFEDLSADCLEALKRAREAAKETGENEQGADEEGGGGVPKKTKNDIEK